jgi:hypothetical protein
MFAVAAFLGVPHRCSTERVLAKDTTPSKADPLPSWKEGSAKNAILDFVKKTTTDGAPDFVAPADRIAVFDNDGTLWPSHEVGDPLPATSINPSAMVEAAKNGLEYRHRGDAASWRLVRKEPRLVVEIVLAAMGHPVLEELAAMLNLQPGLDRYEIVVSPGIVPDPLHFPGSPHTDVELSTRSTAQVWYYLANGVEVPPSTLPRAWRSGRSGRTESRSTTGS